MIFYTESGLEKGRVRFQNGAVSIEDMNNSKSYFNQLHDDYEFIKGILPKWFINMDSIEVDFTSFYNTLEDYKQIYPHDADIYYLLGV